jgi:putative addiction module component (TIGR02574 family)
MTQATEKILSDAMKLSDAERAELAGKLLKTLEPDDGLCTEEEHAASWEAEIKRRLEQLDSGEVKAIPREEAMKMIGRKRMNEAP